MYYVQCFFPNPFKSLITYKSEKIIQPGQWLSVPFGKKSRWALSWSATEKPDIDESKVKLIHNTEPHELIPKNHLKWLEQVGQYYCLNTSDWLSSTVPSSIWESNTRYPSWYTLAIQATDLNPKSNAQKKFYQAVLTQPAKPGYAWLQSGIRISTLQAMLSQKILEVSPVILKPALMRLNTAQQNAFEQIRDNWQFAVTCLEGATGSGKTEVYAHLINHALKKGQNALMLVPEIALTDHLVTRIRKTTGAEPIIYHSDIRSQLRHFHWQLGPSGQPHLWLGTRSAISLPIKNIGLIIVDEEHDSSFRGQTHLRFCARDAAILKAKIENIPVVLGSATPCLHTLHNVNLKKYKKLILPPYWRREYEIKNYDCRGIKLEQGLHPLVLDAIKDYIVKEQQVLVFINRRGYAPVTLCRQCGHAHQCTRCDATTTFHQKRNIQKCHSCGACYPVPKDCPDHPDSMVQVGYGTERICEVLQNLFPDTCIAQIDRDIPQQQRNEALADMHGGKPMVLVGTQMLAKGFDAPNIRMVVVLGVDQALYADDYRAEEKSYQLITQVIGRAGRRPSEMINNKVLIQTYLPHHPMLEAICAQNDAAYRDHLLTVRKKNHLPPYGHISIIWLESKKEPALIAFGNKIASSLPKNKNIAIFGPIPAKQKRRKDFFCYQITLHTHQRSVMHTYLVKINNITDQKPRDIQVIIDRDSRS